MLEVLFDERCLRRLRRELDAAGAREIGGILAAEAKGDGVFQVVALSVQRRGGGVARFVRDASTHRRFMRRFFIRTGFQYRRFNYLGEWHSHPSFVALPSSTDVAQMQTLVEEPGQEARFLVLMVAKLGVSGGLEASVHAFRAGTSPIRVAVREKRGSAISIADAAGWPSPAARAALRRESSTLTWTERQA